MPARTRNLHASTRTAPGNDLRDPTGAALSAPAVHRPDPDISLLSPVLKRLRDGVYADPDLSGQVRDRPGYAKDAIVNARAQRQSLHGIPQRLGRPSGERRVRPKGLSG